MDDDQDEQMEQCVLCDDVVGFSGRKCGQCGEDYPLCIPCSALEEVALCVDCRNSGAGEI